MDPSLRPRRRRRTGRGPLLPNLALIAGLFLRPAHTAPVFSPADAPALTLSHELPAPALHRRITGEHVVLADCRDTANKVSSQMAYYLAEPGPTPEDVAVVVTNPGQAALWINAVTSALFTNTGVTFTATIGPKVAEGEWAGTGDNGYGSFNCWQKYVGGLYRYESTTCSQVYVCNHNAKDNSTTQTSPAETAATSSGGSGSGGMAKGTIIGIAVGVVGGLLFLAAAALVFWFWRRSRKGRFVPAPSTTAPSSGGWPGEVTPAPFLPVMPVMPGAEANEARQAPVMTQMRAVYEVDGRLFRVEMANDHGKFEMDGQPGKNDEVKDKAAVAAAEVQPVSPTTSSFSQGESPVVYEQLPRYRQ